MNILQINSSARVYENGSGSVSTQLAQELSAALQARHEGARLQVRDLARQPHPVLDEAALTALFTPEAQRTPAQAERVALDDALIAELQAADLVVLAVPMYNFGVTAQLKNWIDAVARARVTFAYTVNGPVGLLTGKKVYAVLSRGGVHRDLPSDSQVPYLRAVLGFLGMTDVEFIYAEGLAMGPEAVSGALAQARGRIEQLTRTASEPLVSA
jgi:FMN-dependent NADH-azoreductase